MIALDPDTTKNNFRLWVSVLSPYMCRALFAEVVKDLPIELWILVEVHYMRQSLHLSVHRTRSGLFCLLGFGFGQLLLPRFLHFFHCELVGSHLLLHLTELSLGFLVVALGAAGCCTSFRGKLFLETFVFFFEFTDELILG